MDSDKKSGARFMNTYRLESRRPFMEDKVVAILKEVMEGELHEARYDPATCTKTAAELCLEVRNRVKLQMFDRYKIVCQMTIVQKNLQSVYSCMRGVWDTGRDRFAIHRFENTNIMAVGMVAGVYYE